MHAIGKPRQAGWMPALACCALLLLQSAPVVAQEYRPGKPVRIIMSNAVGSPHDITMRGAAQVLSQTFGQPFIVDNRTAGRGVIATTACVQSAPDGHTICLNSFINISLNPYLYPDTPYDVPRDLVPVIRLGAIVSALLVGANVPVNSVRELFEFARQKPGSVTFAHFGVGSVNNLIMEWAKRERGVEFYAVPYKVSVQSLNALLSGETQVALYAVAVMVPHVKQGRAKALAVMGARRHVLMPSVPTLREAGIELDLDNWTGIFMPAGTRREIVQRLNQEFGKLIADAAFRDKIMLPSGLEPDDPNTPEAFAAFIKRDREMYENLIRSTGLKGD